MFRINIGMLTGKFPDERVSQSSLVFPSQVLSTPHQVACPQSVHPQELNAGDFFCHCGMP